MKRRGFIAWDTFIPWAIAVFVIIITVLIYLAFTDKGSGLISYIKDIWRFR